MKSKYFLIGIGLSTFALVGCQALATSQGENGANQTASVVSPPISSESSVNKTSNSENQGQESAQPQYLAYSDELYNSLLGEKPFALFFHADWCPTCREMEKNITADLGSFPDGTILVKANYDTETALKQKYGITSQSFIVAINDKGEVTDKLMAPDNAKIKAAINKSQ